MAVEHIHFCEHHSGASRISFAGGAGDAMVDNMLGVRADQVSSVPDVRPARQRLVFAAPPLVGQNGVFNYVQGMQLGGPSTPISEHPVRVV